MRVEKNFSVDDIKSIKQKLFKWIEQFNVSICLDTNDYPQKYTSFDFCIAVEEFTSIKTDYSGAFDALKEYQSYTKDYIFGYLSYDLKNDVEPLTSSNYDGLGFDDLYFFQPQKIIFVKGNQLIFKYLKMVDDEIDSDFEEIKDIELYEEFFVSALAIKPRISKEEYQKKIEKALEYIQKGDVYELNFCQEFYAENAEVNPYSIYKNLNKISEPPFASFMRIDEKYLISSTPERYLRSEENKIISQPIKGTAKRFENQEEDQKAILGLKNDQKERAENIMIVDLVRNDLSKSAKKASVKVEELCEVYTFKQVHQLISTIVSEVEHTTHSVDILRDTFPMGSMTGAPKLSAMQIIEKLEETKRGLYSGAVGYFTPEGNFDFNVVIRSILYNFDNKYISYIVGGAITSKSAIEKEYQECILKAKAMKQVLK